MLSGRWPVLLVYFAATACAGCTARYSVAAARPPAEPARPTVVRDAFMAAVERAGVETPYWPRIGRQARGTRVEWREEQRSVFVPTWENAPPRIRNRLAPVGGRSMFRLVYRWLLPTAALVRCLQDEFGWPHTRDTARAACTLAVAFLAGQPGGPATLRRIQTHLATLRQLPRPGESGWGDWGQALEQQDQADFTSLLRQLVERHRPATAVVLSPARDAGFHLAALLDGAGSAGQFFEPTYREAVDAIRAQLGIPDVLLRDGPARSLVRRLAVAPRMHRLVRLPALFSSFNESRAAFTWLLGTPGPARIRPEAAELVRACLPRLAAVRGQATPEERRLGRDLVALIQYELESFHAAQHRYQHPKWDWSRRRFRDRWYRRVQEGTVSAPDNVRQVVIILTPALQHRCVRYPLHAGVARMALPLPVTPAKMEHVLRAAADSLTRIARGDHRGSLCRPPETP